MSMQKRTIDSQFRIRVSGTSDWYPMTIPGSAMDTFFREGILPDPYDGLNESKWTDFFRHDFDIQGVFEVTPEELACGNLILTFYGIDTVADLFLNGVRLGHTENMHRIWRFSVRDLVKEGENLLELHMTSPIRFIEAYQPEKGREIHLANTGTMMGGQYLRKAHSMFGWDWGPKLPDVGIFRKIELCCYQKARLGETLIRQQHLMCTAADGTVPETVTVPERVTLSLETEVLGEDLSGADLSYEVLDPEGTRLYQGPGPAVNIPEPQLWWPHGCGSQPLYTVRVSLRTPEDGTEQKEYRIGLRTVTVSREEDAWGQEFAIQVNGVKIFARGADYIPDDCFYSRITREVLKRDVEAAVFANFNCLRVWGGGYYPSDEFYDLCDEYGILLWQDLMYACNIYDLNPAFIENISQETRDNLLRFRNHACLALICGNNEMETAWTDWKDAQGHTPSLKRDYLLQFEYILPAIVKELAPDTFYWPSSPSSGGSFDEPGDENRGDCHYWDVWHGQKPFSEYQKHYFRFCSEFGFQSLPSIKTVETFTEEKDRNLFSRVMENHQKNPAANGKILYYLSETFRYPRDLESLIFLSQILQGYAMKEATEHWRRNRGRCMGSIYWQFNDNWPVASWSSMDYYGRYKALHYMARNFCDSVAGSIEKKETAMSFWISNESLSDRKVQARISLKTLDFAVLAQAEVTAEVKALSAQRLFEQDYAELLKDREDRVFLCVEYRYEEDGKTVEKTEFETFVPMKYLELEDPRFTVNRMEGGSVEISAKTFVPYCMLEGVDSDPVWMNNVVSITDSRPVLLKAWGEEPAQTGEIRIYDVYHTY
ncbi:MAG: glycoside hydrolase family 2 protein [Candidatus Limivivens sp.]|nr:glycoside hydrolase family 2 protein [Candidatus Limivivens sp.]